MVRKIDVGVDGTDDGKNDDHQQRHHVLSPSSSSIPVAINANNKGTAKISSRKTAATTPESMKSGSRIAVTKKSPAFSRGGATPSAHVSSSVTQADKGSAIAPSNVMTGAGNAADDEKHMKSEVTTISSSSSNNVDTLKEATHNENNDQSCRIDHKSSLDLSVVVDVDEGPLDFSPPKTSKLLSPRKNHSTTTTTSGSSSGARHLNFLPDTPPQYLLHVFSSDTIQAYLPFLCPRVCRWKQRIYPASHSLCDY